jgi:hypothetical protein
MWKCDNWEIWGCKNVGIGKFENTRPHQKPLSPKKALKGRNSITVGEAHGKIN